jgi:hypothetical protein
MATIGQSTAMGQGIDRLPGSETPVGSAARISFRTEARNDSASVKVTVHGRG